MTATAGPLAGLRVLETASLYAAPLLATFLADQGADVTKVEPPGGDPYRDWPALWALVVGSYEIQTHVATAGFVIAMSGVLGLSLAFPSTSSGDASSDRPDCGPTASPPSSSSLP